MTDTSTQPLSQTASPTVGDAVAPVRTDSEVLEKAARRRFTAKYKQGILAEADACTEAGEM